MKSHSQLGIPKVIFAVNSPFLTANYDYLFTRADFKKMFDRYPKESELLPKLPDLCCYPCNKQDTHGLVRSSIERLVIWQPEGFSFKQYRHEQNNRRKLQLADKMRRMRAGKSQAL
jgi:hypothetical protein